VDKTPEQIADEYMAKAGIKNTGQKARDFGSGSFTRASEIEMTSINWLWSNHLARKKITMLAGDPDLGKSQIAMSFAALLTKTGEWPDGDPAPHGSVIVLSAEDSIDDTIVPRSRSRERRSFACLLLALRMRRARPPALVLDPTGSRNPGATSAPAR